MNNIGTVTIRETPEDIFNEAMKSVFSEEGGYANDEDDLGGETFVGISRKFNPKWEGWQIIDELKKDYQTCSINFKEGLAKENIYAYVTCFYKKNYWDVLRLDKINFKKVSIKIFDMSINLGIPRVAAIVQTCLNIMNCDTQHELKVDNIIGPMTINLINEFCKKDNGDLLLKLLCFQQGYIYMKLVQNNSTQKKFLKGWINRVGISVD